MPKPLYGENGSGMHINQSLSRGGPERVLRPERRAAALGHGLRLHRRPARAPAGADGDLQPDGQLLQAADPGLRGAGLHRVVARQPLGRDPHPGQARPLDACRAAHARPDGQSVPGVRLPAAGGARRRPPRPAPAGARQRQHLPPLGRGVGEARHQGPAAQPRGRAHGARGRLGAQDGARRPHLRRLHQREARASGPTTASRCTTGSSSSTSTGTRARCRTARRAATGLGRAAVARHACAS